jgi:hypothetical protein
MGRDKRRACSAAQHWNDKQGMASGGLGSCRSSVRFHLARRVFRSAAQAIVLLGIGAAILTACAHTHVVHHRAKVKKLDCNAITIQKDLKTHKLIVKPKCIEVAQPMGNFPDGPRGALTWETW